MSGIGLGWLALTYMKIFDINELGNFVIIESYEKIRDLHKMENIILQYSDDQVQTKKRIK